MWKLSERNSPPNLQRYEVPDAVSFGNGGPTGANWIDAKFRSQIVSPLQLVTEQSNETLRCRIGVGRILVESQTVEHGDCSSHVVLAGDCLGFKYLHKLHQDSRPGRFGAGKPSI